MKTSTALFAVAFLGCSPPPPPQAPPAQAPPAPASSSHVSGRLPPELIQREVRSHFQVFRKCYEDGLRANPWLKGRVSIRFVIGRDGAVSNVGNGGSTMPDAKVTSCVLRAFYGLTFPMPEGGIVTVTYPIMFSPGGDEEGPKARVPSGTFQGCEARHGEASGAKHATIECEGYTILFEDLPVPFTEANAKAEVDPVDATPAGGHAEQSPTTIGGVQGWAVTGVAPGAGWMKTVAVPTVEARLRVVSCGAKPPTPAAQDACQRAIEALVKGGLAEIPMSAPATPPPSPTKSEGPSP